MEYVHEDTSNMEDTKLNKLSVVSYQGEYYVYQGYSIKGMDPILKGQEYSWSVLKSIYDH